MTDRVYDPTRVKLHCLCRKGAFAHGLIPFTRCPRPAVADRCEKPLVSPNGWPARASGNRS